MKATMMVSSSVKMMLMAVSMIVLMMANPSKAISCGEVNSKLAPCLPYLIGGSDLPAAECCDGLKNLKSMTVTTVDKQTACNCAKEAASQHKEIKEDLASALAAKCGVELDVPISKTTDCASIK